MEDQNIVRIAVWNIWGPTQGKNYPITTNKINAFQKEISPDLAFYLEAPSLKKNEHWEKSFHEQAEPDNPNNPKGILAVQYKNSKVRMERVCINNTGRAVAGVKIFHGDTEILHLLAVWTIPDYLTQLKKIIEDYKKLDFFSSKDKTGKKIPCIVIGDTNINLSASANTQEELCEDGCWKNAEDLKKLSENCGLTFPLPLSKSRIPNGKPLNTLFDKNIGPWSRCDLMMISDPSILVSAFLGEREYKDDQGKTYNSDHNPIIFEISVP